jgi:murein L,D-transpeptidase YcbB/YkuD
MMRAQTRPHAGQVRNPVIHGEGVVAQGTRAWVHGRRASGIRAWPLVTAAHVLLVLLAGMFVACRADTPSLETHSQTQGAALWVREGGALTRAGGELLAELAAADRRGLRPADYNAAELNRRALLLAQSTPAGRAAFDAMMSAAAATLVSDLHAGRVKPKEVGYDLDVSRPAFDVAQAVRSLAASTDVSASLDALEPQLRHYALLKSALARYRALAAQGSSLTQLPPLPRKSVAPGETYEGASSLRALLVALGDMRSAGQDARAALLDADLVEALKRFQTRHGLDPDGVLGPATFRALTTPMSARVQQIELSLERIRWLPSQLESPPIIVNIPQFRLFAFRTTQDRADEILQMDVIVGETFEGRRTPVFAADMQYLVLNPYWDVPRSILVKELLPQIRSNPAWVGKQGYEIVRGGGDDARPLPVTSENIQLLAEGALRLRQKPGPGNALGRVKFMFPNRHNVYLHDTPARALFLRTRRAFSHGCIRVSDPMALLAHVLRSDPTWTPERLEAAFARGTPVRIPLRQPIRVFILYGTALATEAGSVLFFEDLYGQDAPLIARLNARKIA